MTKQDQKKKFSLGKLIGLLIVLFATDTEVFSMVLAIVLMLGPIALVGWLIYRHVKNQNAGTVGRKITYSRKQETLDDCPKPLFCFHTDKAEHHVARGKEIDPWDRPDIDISKYQRRG